MPLKNLIRVTPENIHEIIPTYINDHQIIIATFEGMMEVILQMIRDKHLFVMNRDILRECMIDLTYMYCPGDDVNKDRIMAILDPDDSDSDDEDILDIPPIE